MPFSSSRQPFVSLCLCGDIPLNLQGIDLLLQIPGYEPSIFFLKLFLSPILTGNHLAAVWLIASAFHFVSIVIRCRPVVSQLFSWRDITHSDKYDLPLDTNIRITRMISEDHTAASAL